MNGHLKETRKVMSDGKETSLPVMLRGSSWCSHAQLTALNEPILYCSHLHLGSTSKRLIRLHWDKHDLKESLKWCDCDYTTSWADLVTAQMYEEIRLNAELKVSWQSSEHLTRKLETYRDQFAFHHSMKPEFSDRDPFADLSVCFQSKIKLSIVSLHRRGSGELPCFRGWSPGTILTLREKVSMRSVSVKDSP